MQTAGAASEANNGATNAESSVHRRDAAATRQASAAAPAMATDAAGGGDAAGSPIVIGGSGSGSDDESGGGLEEPAIAPSAGCGGRLEGRDGGGVHLLPYERAVLTEMLEEVRACAREAFGVACVPRFGCHKSVPGELRKLATDLESPAPLQGACLRLDDMSVAGASVDIRAFGLWPGGAPRPDAAG
eukprot:353069-Chlamydomonas_euryale.AAC.37